MELLFTFFRSSIWRRKSWGDNESSIGSNLPVAQNGRFIMSSVYSKGGTMMSAGLKILNFGLSESLEIELSMAFFSPKLSLESWNLHCLCKNFPENPRHIITEISIIVYSVPQHFSCLKNYKLCCFSNSTWKNDKDLTFKPGSSQNRRFQEETGGRELSCQNGRVWTFGQEIH